MRKKTIAMLGIAMSGLSMAGESAKAPILEPELESEWSLCSIYDTLGTPLYKSADNGETWAPVPMRCSKLRVEVESFLTGSQQVIRTDRVFTRHRTI